MAELTYLFEQTASPSGAVLSATKSMIYDLSVDLPVSITNLPLETGRPVTDNAVDEPITVNVSGIASVIPDSSNPSRVMTMLAQLRRDRTLLTLITATATYENMLIKSVGVSENRDTGLSLPVSLQLQQIEFIDVEFSELVPQKILEGSPAENMPTTVDTGITNPQLASAPNRQALFTT